MELQNMQFKVLNDIDWACRDQKIIKLKKDQILESLNPGDAADLMHFSHITPYVVQAFVQPRQPAPRVPEVKKQDDEDADKSVMDYSEDDLIKISEDDGIDGLRAIADPLNIKAKSKRELIDEILMYQMEQDEANEG